MELNVAFSPRMYLRDLDKINQLTVLTVYIGNG